jgi:cation transport ATPase
MTDPNEPESGSTPESTTPPETPAAKKEPTPAEQKAAEFSKTVKAMTRQDQMVLFGSAALVILFFLPWYSFSMNFGGMSQSQSVGGLHEAAWIGFLAALAATGLALARTGIFGPGAAGAQKAAGNPILMLVVTAIALLLGPIYFWSQVGDAPSGVANQFVSAGKTFFFWLALLSALVAAGGAAWKLAEQKNAKPPA